MFHTILKSINPTSEVYSRTHCPFRVLETVNRISLFSFKTRAILIRRCVIFCTSHAHIFRMAFSFQLFVLFILLSFPCVMLSGKPENVVIYYDDDDVNLVQQIRIFFREWRGRLLCASSKSLCVCVQRGGRKKEQKFLANLPIKADSISHQHIYAYIHLISVIRKQYLHLILVFTVELGICRMRVRFYRNRVRHCKCIICYRFFLFQCRLNFAYSAHAQGFFFLLYFVPYSVGFV